MPLFLKDMPVSTPEIDMLIRDWVALSSCRAFSSMGTPMAIPWTAIDAYAARHGINGVAFEEFETAIAACEQVYAAHVEKVSKK